MSNDGHPLLVLLVCLLKSFKELFIYQTLTKGHQLLSGEPLFSEASAKVRTFSEPRKSFREKFSNLTHFPAVVDGGQGHIRHTHYYILYRRRGNGAGGTEGGDGRVEDTGGGNYYCPVKLSFLILKFTGQ